MAVYSATMRCVNGIIEFFVCFSGVKALVPKTGFVMHCQSVLCVIVKVNGVVGTSVTVPNWFPMYKFVPLVYEPQ